MVKLKSIDFDIYFFKVLDTYLFLIYFHDNNLPYMLKNMTNSKCKFLCKYVGLLTHHNIYLGRYFLFERKVFCEQFFYFVKIKVMSTYNLSFLNSVHEITLNILLLDNHIYTHGASVTKILRNQIHFS